MGTLRKIGWMLAGAAVPVLGYGQTHKVAKTETVVRAVGVYEWTGELAKPTASRLIPVTLYIDKHLEDAGVYLSRPVPFVLQSGNIFELDEAGVSKGTLELSFARHLQATTGAQAYDDGWFGYGTYKGLPVPKKAVIRKLAPARTAGIETASSAGDPDKPHFSDKAGKPVTPASGGGSASKGGSDGKDDAADASADTAGAKDSTEKSSGATPAGDPDRPTMKRRSGSDTGSTDAATTTSAGPTPADDPDRPTMKKRSGNDTASTTSADASVSPDPNDPDRPTLKRHSVEDAKKKAKGDSEANVSGTGSLNDDPDRPNLHRGKPTRAMTDADLPKLAGLPVDLKQMVAVSDAATRPAHDFARAWEDDAERVAILGKMQGIAQAQLAVYGGAAAATAPVAKAAPAAAGRPNSKLRQPRGVKQVALVSLQDEQLKGYLLSYGDTPTFVYQAHTGGTGDALRYVTIVAQRDAQGEPVMVLHNVTDATHMDRTPRLRLVDAVDLEASNRASLLFEMRGQNSRQFGVYRVLGLQAQPIFSTGTMQ